MTRQQIKVLVVVAALAAIAILLVLRLALRRIDEHLLRSGRHRTLKAKDADGNKQPLQQPVHAYLPPSDRSQFRSRGGDSARTNAG